jgi:hypothetical protein
VIGLRCEDTSLLGARVVSIAVMSRGGDGGFVRSDNDRNGSGFASRNGGLGEP